MEKNILIPSQAFIIFGFVKYTLTFSKDSKIMNIETQE